MILLFFSILAVLLSLALLVKSRQNYKGNYYLSVFFFLSGLWGVANYGVFFSQSSMFAVLATGHFTPFLFLSGQALYFYIRSVLFDDFRLKKSDWLHLIPFLLIAISLTPYYLTDPDGKIEIVNKIRITKNLASENYFEVWPWTISMLLRPIYYIFYVILSSKLIQNYEQYVKVKKANRESYYRYFTIWMNLLMAAISMIAGVFIFLNLIYLFYQETNHHLYLQMVEVLIVFVLAFLNLSFLLIPTLSFGLPKSNVIATAPEEQVSNAELVAESAVSSIHEINLLTDDYIEMMKHQIEDYLQDKPFVTPSFNKVNLSAGTNIPLHHLSYFFNQIVEKSFADWRNELRIEYAIEMIKSGKAKLVTLDTIARESGFANQTTFISSFKKYTGTTPYNFIKGTHLDEE